MVLFEINFETSPYRYAYIAIFFTNMQKSPVSIEEY